MNKRFCGLTVAAMLTVAGTAFCDDLTSNLTFLPDGRPATLVLGGKDCLKKEMPGGGFVLNYFDGVKVREETMPVVERDGDKLVVSKEDGIPKLTFRVVTGGRYLALHLVRVEGFPVARNISLGLQVNCIEPVEIVELDGKVWRVTGKGVKNLIINWPYLWHRNPDDSLGAFALYVAGNDTDADLALADIWAHEPIPKPAGQGEWTVEKVNEWVKAYHDKFAGMSEITLSAGTPDELYFLTEQARKAGIRRVYLHTDTWRKEYWPRYRSHVDVNPDVFPGGRADLVKYSDYLHEHGMLLRLHNVSGGIGWHDPERIMKRVHRELASWGGGRLASAVGKEEKELLFRPDSGTMVPTRSDIAKPGGSLNGSYMAVDYIRIDNEIIRVGQFADLDKPVWRLLGCQRGQGGTQATAHDAEAEGVGLFAPYSQNLIPDLDSPLLEQMASEYAALVNEAKLDHIHFDGREIHDQYPWGWKKFTNLVYSKVDHAVTSSSSGGGPIPANFEMRFSTVRAMHELDYHGVLMPIGLAGHREATSWLDTHFCIQAMLGLGTRRVVLQKPEPMFGVSREIFEKHGLAPQVFALAGQWIDLLPHFRQTHADILAKYISLKPSKLRLGGTHNQGADVLVLEKRGLDYQWVPTRVMTRKSGDVPWRFGQEHGARGPRQFIRPRETVELDNPYQAQVPTFILHVLPECVENVSGFSDATGPLKKTIEDDYATGVNTGVQSVRKKQVEKPASPEQLQPLAKEVVNQRYATFVQDSDGVIVSAQNPTADPVWNENNLPEWKRTQSMAKGRGLALEVDGDGSEAVLVIQLMGRGVRDYVVKIDFQGRREIVIPNGEVAWANGHWSYRMGSSHFDYEAPLTAVRMGFGYIPPKTNPRVRVARLRSLTDVPSELRDPIIRIGTGTLAVKGSVATGNYLQYKGGDTVQVYDCNWNHKADLPTEKKDFIMPKGIAPVAVEVSGGAPQPWISAQFITIGTAIPLTEIANSKSGDK
jgi:hypothetical protein